MAGKNGVVAEPAWLPLDVVERFVAAAASRGVSRVARGPGGFLAAYRAAAGDARALAPPWRRKRAGFVARHLAQLAMRREPLFEAGGGGEAPTRRHLALVMWAFSPAPSSLRRMGRA